MKFVGPLLLLGLVALIAIVFLRRSKAGRWHERPARHCDPVADSAVAVLVPLTDRQAAYWRTVMADHANREWYGCTICHTRDCRFHCDALANLAMAGRCDWDPIRDRNTR